MYGTAIHREEQAQNSPRTAEELLYEQPYRHTMGTGFQTLPATCRPATHAEMAPRYSPGDVNCITGEVSFLLDYLFVPKRALCLSLQSRSGNA